MKTDYTEITKKDGTTVIFCNFEELLKECFGVGTIEQVHSHKKVNGEYICHCPFCREEGHTKEKLYIKDDLSVGHCFVCGRAFVNVDDKISFEYKTPLFWNQWQDLEVIKLQDPTWSLDKYHFDFDDYDPEGVKYLESRHPFMKDLWKNLEIKFWEGNPVAPFKYHNEVFYYQIRFANVPHGSDRPRYFFPPMPTGTKPPYIIEVGDKKKFVICEGVYDAISLLIQAPGYTPFAVLGSCITDYQVKFLREYVPNEIIIYMDETEISIRIAEKLRFYIDYCPIKIIKSDGTDPEENMLKRLKYGKSLSWIGTSKS